MNAKLTGRLNMMTAFVALLHGPETETIWKKVPAFQQAVDELEDLVEEIVAAAEAQDARRGPAADKARALQLLGDEAHAVVAATHACAVASGNEALALRTDVSRSSVTKGRDAAILARCKEIHATASDLLDSLADYNVTAADLNSLKKKIDAFESVRSKPREKIASSTAATKRLAKLFRQVNTVLSRRLDRLVVKFKATQPKFYEEYKAARFVGGRSGRGGNVESIVAAPETTVTPPVAKAA